jgi:hypothetical protein
MAETVKTGGGNSVGDSGGGSGGNAAGNSAKLTLDEIPKYWYPDRLADMREVGIGYPLNCTYLPLSAYSLELFTILQCYYVICHQKERYCLIHVCYNSHKLA